MVWQLVGDWFVNLPSDFFDPDPIKPEPRITRRKQRNPVVQRSIDDIIAADDADQYNEPSLEVVKMKPKHEPWRKGGRPQGVFAYTFESVIEQYKNELVNIYRGGRLMAELTYGRIGTLRKYGVLMKPKEVIQNWDHHLTPGAVAYMGLET